MSELTVLSSNLPAHLAALGGLDDITRSLMGSGGGVPRISIEGGVFRMMMNGKEVAKNEDRAMNIVIVNAAPKVSRIFYAGVYKKGSVSAPNCWSPDGETPDPTARDKQANSCKDCPQNIQGSGVGNSRACRFQQRIAVMLGHDLDGEVYQLTLPSMSIFGEGEPGKWPLQTYARLIGTKGIPISAVVTEMRFDTDSQSPKLTFKPVRYLETVEFNKAVEKGQSAAAIKAITMTVAQADGVPDDAIDIVGTPPAAAMRTPAPAEAVVEDTPEPTKRAAKKEEPAPKKDISKVLAEWDDE
jgi:hypothetical protein